MIEVSTLEEGLEHFAISALPVKAACKSAKKVCKDRAELEGFYRYMQAPPPQTNEINLYFHCATCAPMKPKGLAPREWSNIQAGWTAHGIQVWCNRCDKSVIHIDLLGAKIAAV